MFDKFFENQVLVLRDYSTGGIQLVRVEMPRKIPAVSAKKLVKDFLKEQLNG